MENDNSPELIEQQMQDTRNSLTEKVATLEQTVVGTLQSATSVVQETVDTVKDTVESVRSAMTETVASVKDSVQESVESMTDNVRHAFDISDHVRNNPWMMVGGAVAAGFVTGMFAFRSRTEERERYGSNFEANGGGYRYERPSEPASYAARVSEPSSAAEPTWLDRLFDRAGQELRRLGEQAFDQATQALQQNVHQFVPQLVKEAEARLGSVLGGLVGETHSSSSRPM